MSLTEKETHIRKAIAKLKIEQLSDDYEGSHWNADKILCDLLNKLGAHDVVNEFDKINKWYA